MLPLCTTRYHARHNTKILIFCGRHTTEYHLLVSEVLTVTLMQASGSKCLKQNAEIGSTHALKTYTGV